MNKKLNATASFEHWTATVSSPSPKLTCTFFVADFALAHGMCELRVFITQVGSPEANPKEIIDSHRRRTHLPGLRSVRDQQAGGPLVQRQHLPGEEVTVHAPKRYSHGVPRGAGGRRCLGRALM